MDSASAAPGYTTLPGVFPRWSYVGCAVVAFAIHLLLANRLHQLQVFAQYDVLFNADPNEGLVNLSHGWGKSEFKHLTLTYLFSPIARLFAFTVRTLSLSSAPDTVLREQFSLVLLAAFSAVRGVLFLEVARFLGLRLHTALLLGALAFFAFSNLMFGGIPESFPLSATCLVVGYYLALKPRPGADTSAPSREGLRAEALCWGMLFVAGVGITITNAIPLSVLLLLRQLRHSKRSLRGSVVLIGCTAMAAVGTNLALAAAAQRIQQTRTVEIAYSPATDQYVHEPTTAVLTSLARAFGNGVFAGSPSLGPLVVPTGKVGWYTTIISYELGRAIPPWDWLGLLLLGAALVLGVVGYHKAGQHLAVLWGSLAIVLSNVAIHLFFGDEYVLYSLHWHYSVMVIIAGGLVLLQSKARRGSWIVAGTLIAVIAANNLLRVRGIVETLADRTLAAPLGIVATP